VPLRLKVWQAIQVENSAQNQERLRAISVSVAPRTIIRRQLKCRDLKLVSNRRSSMRRLWTVLAALATLSLTNCGYNVIQSQDEQVKSSWSEVVNQYQRRADLVPNLVNSVKGFAQQEKDVLLGVTNARAKVGSIQATPEVLNDPAAFQKFQAAQGEFPARCRDCWWSPKTIRSSNPTRCSAI
jgi:hypothetical protein